MKGLAIALESFKPLAPLIGGKGGPLDEPLVRIANAHSATPNAVLLRWQMQQGNVAVTTSRTPSRPSEYVRAMDFVLAEEEMEEITGIGASHHYRAAGRMMFDENDRT
jgi:diketogulonate reductase-like aldo/keto reductase